MAPLIAESVAPIQPVYDLLCVFAPHGATACRSSSMRTQRHCRHTLAHADEDIECHGVLVVHRSTR